MELSDIQSVLLPVVFYVSLNELEIQLFQIFKKRNPTTMNFTTMIYGLILYPVCIGESENFQEDMDLSRRASKANSLKLIKEIDLKQHLKHLYSSCKLM